MIKDIEKYLEVQNIALSVLNDIKHHIVYGVTEKEIALTCENLFKKYGVTESWYHGVMALVLVGRRTTLSLSGRDYLATDTVVQENDLITIDVSPVLNGFWGDCARSYVVESGGVVKEISDEELKDGIEAEKKLHIKMQDLVCPAITMHELYLIMNKEINDLGYKNLDFNNNLGHSIEKDINSRSYIEKNNNIKLEEVTIFTFEPHIAKERGHWGFKRENIYYFENGNIKVMGQQDLLTIF